MKLQWNVIFGLIFALLVALFAVFNVNQVEVDYLFGTAQIPLILVIIGSALLGGLMVGSFGIVRQYRLQWKIKKLTQELDKANEALKAASVYNAAPEQTAETLAEDAEQSQPKPQSQSQEVIDPAKATAATPSTSASSAESSDNRDCEESQASQSGTSSKSPEQNQDLSSSPSTSTSQNSDKS